MEQEEIKRALGELLRSQCLAVLATHDEGRPYANLVAFAATDDLRTILFATPRTTRKYANLVADPRAAVLVDNRSNEEADFHRAMAATATGPAREVAPSDRRPWLELYLKKHPHLEDFVRSPTCACMELSVERYVLVNRFQQVTELHLS